MNINYNKENVLKGGAIALVASLVTSITVNIFQYRKNKKLRIQLEKLTLVLRSLQEQVNDLKMERKNIRIWQFKQRCKKSREIRLTKKTLRNKQREYNNINKQIKK